MRSIRVGGAKKLQVKMAWSFLYIDIRLSDSVILDDVVHILVAATGEVDKD